MADKDYTSLLGRRNQSWTQIAAELLQEQKNKNKKQKRRQRQALIGGLLLSAWDNSKLSNAARNLREADNDKQYDIADATQKWEAYSKFVEADKKIKSSGDIKEGATNPYFLELAEIEFNQTNPDFDTRYAGRDDRYSIRTEQIKNVAEVLQTDHINKRNNIQSAQNIDLYKGINRPYLTREEFIKPWNEYYRAKESRLSDPSELSAVHSLFGLVGPAKSRRVALDNRMESYQTQINALNKAYNDLVTPTELSKIQRFYNPDAISFSREEAVLYLEKMFAGQADQTLKRSLQNEIRSTISTADDPATLDKIEDRITETALNSTILAGTYDFDLSKAKREQLGNDFDKAWSARTGKSIDDIAKLNPNEKEVYDGERYVHIEKGMGREPENLIKLREAIVSIKAEKLNANNLGVEPNLDIILYHQKVIDDLTTSTKDQWVVSEFDRIYSLPSLYQIWLERWDVKDDALNPTGVNSLATGKKNYFIHLYNELEIAQQSKIN
jgi:hypothetical protein